MSLIDIITLIPKPFQQKVLDTLVEFVSGQAKEHLGDQVSDKIDQLRSDAAFRRSFRAGLQRATRRFIQEYELEDEDLVAAIANTEDFFENQQVREALLEIIKNPGTYLVDERQAVIQSFETVLPARKNRKRVDRAVTFFLRCLAEEVWTLPELRPLYAFQFQRMTADAARQQLELHKAQLQETTELRADIRDALMQLTDKLLEQKSLPAPDSQEHAEVFHNLPQPDYGRFVGRREELAQVHRILRPYPNSRHPLVTIDGIGGIGKSALALEAALHYLRDYDHLQKEERFEAIVWTSAKSSVLTADGIMPRRQITRTLDDIYTTIAVTLDREDITRARPEEQDKLVSRALTKQRTLLIVDNLETIDDERVNAFLRELPAPTKAIVTTRHRIDVAYPIRLNEMSKTDALDLIAQECKKKDVSLSEIEPSRLFKRTGGVPLAIVWSVAQMGYGYGVEEVLQRLEHPGGDIAHFCFDRAIDLIRDRPSYTLLMALSSFPSDANRDALGYVTSLSELTRDESLVTLEKLSLVNRNDGRFSLLPLTKRFGSIRLVPFQDNFDMIG
jgi:hypothetical protein